MFSCCCWTPTEALANPAAAAGMKILKFTNMTMTTTTMKEVAINLQCCWSGSEVLMLKNPSKIPITKLMIIEHAAGFRSILSIQ